MNEAESKYLVRVVRSDAQRLYETMLNGNPAEVSEAISEMTPGEAFFTGVLFGGWIRLGMNAEYLVFLAEQELLRRAERWMCENAEERIGA